MNIDPTYESSNSGKDFYKAIDKKAKSILKRDVYFQYREAARKGMAEGLIRPKTTEEIHKELKQKPWLKVNKIIKKNKQQ